MVISDWAYRKTWSASFALLLCMLPALAAAALSTSVERTVIHEGDTFVLHVKQTGQTNQRPDFSPLEYDFEIIRRSQSSQTRIINFKTEHWVEWNLVLAPRRLGTLVIPSIRAGSESSRPITVEVRKGNAPAQGGNRDVFLDVEVDRQRAWVQSQVIVTVRVFHRGRLDGNLTDPEVDNAVIESLGDQRKYDTIQQGIRYQVIERRFAVFPQRSGTLEIPPVTLTGTMEDSSSSVFGFRPFGPSQGRTVHIRSKRVEIEVMPKPDDWPSGETWLPAADLSLTEEWSPNTNRLEVGEAITRTVRLRATGLAASQLPQPEMNWPATVKTYPEAPERKNFQNFDGITGTATFSTAMIPTEGGTLTVPEVRVAWWNTRLKRREVTTIPARRFQVKGAINVQPPAPVPSQRDESENQTSPAPSGTIGVEPTSGNESGAAWGWIALCLFLLSGWAITAFLWFRQKQTGSGGAVEQAAMPVQENLSERKAMHALRKACRENQPVAARAALLSWARSYFGLPHGTSLEQLLSHVADSRLRNAALELDDFLYRNAPGTNRDWNGAILLEATEQFIRSHQKENSQNRKDLPSLYFV